MQEQVDPRCPPGYDFPFYSDPEIVSYMDALRYVRETITFTTDMDNFGVEDYWQNPRRTMINGSGDTEDMAILFLYLCVIHLHDYSGYLEKYYTEDGYVFVACFGENLYDPSGLLRFYYPSLCEYICSWDYEDAISIASNRHKP
jgi:hypothetical protein